MLWVRTRINGPLCLSTASVSVRHDLNNKSSRPHHILKNNDTYTVVNKGASLQHQQQQQQQSFHGMRKAGSYRDVDQMERETVSAMRVSGQIVSKDPSYSPLFLLHKKCFILILFYYLFHLPNICNISQFLFCFLMFTHPHNHSRTELGRVSW